MENNEESIFLRHGPCEACGSSDGNAEYSNGTTYCFSCSTWDRGNSDTPKMVHKSSQHMSLLQYEYQDLTKRKIPENIAKQYRYGVGVDSSGKMCQIANYFNKDKEVVGQKLRYADKKFKFIGDSKQSLMFGQNLFRNGGKKLTITEGEIDALSVATAFDGKYPVVSLKGGAKSAKKEITTHLEWISSYDEIYLWFDNDEHGRAAVDECVQILPTNKVKIIRHSEYKDANEVLIYTGKGGVVSTFYEAESYRPDDIVSPLDIIDSVTEPVQIGFPYMYDSMTQILYGRRFGEVVTLGAGVAAGKTDFVMGQIAFDLQQGWPVATFMLEQTVKETVLRVSGKIDGQHYHLPNSEFNSARLKETVGSLDNLYMHDNFGSCEWEVIRGKIRYMKHSYGCRIFYIDNLTALNAHAGDERRNLDALMAEVAGLAKELDVWIMLVSHLNPTKNGPAHESGGKTEQHQFTGSRSIMRWSSTMLGLERNSLHSEENERHKGLIRVLKDRFSGSATGRTIGFRYDPDTGLTHETVLDFEIPEDKGETNEGEAFTDF